MTPLVIAGPPTALAIPTPPLASAVAATPAIMTAVRRLVLIFGFNVFR
jgi:hypothetical protein